MELHTRMSQYGFMPTEEAAASAGTAQNRKLDQRLDNANNMRLSGSSWSSTLRQPRASTPSLPKSGVTCELVPDLGNRLESTK